MEHLHQHLFFLFLSSSLSSLVTYRVAVTAMAGCQGAQPGPCSAPWWLPPSPAGRAAARLAAGAGCAGCWHKPPPADGVNPWRLQRNLGGFSPRSAGGLSTGTSNQGLATVGRNRTCDNRLSAGLYQTELPVVARLESNQTLPSEWSPRPCRRYPAFAMCGMQNIDRTRRPRTPGTGGANFCSNPDL